MLKFRAISFPLLLALCFLMLFWEAGGPYIFLVVATGAMMLLTDELLRILEKLGTPGMRRIAAATVGVVTAFLILCLNHDFPIIWPMLLAIPLLPLVLLLRLLFGGDKAAFLRRLFPTVGAVYLVLLIYLPMVVLFSFIGDEPDHLSHHGTHPLPERFYSFLFLFFILTTKAMDTGGYVFGLLSNRLLPGGNHKIAPTISPKKSWEGFFGGILLALAVAAALQLTPFAPALVWWKPLTAALLLALGSFFGDLTESALKRAADIKDSGSYIPGMGGIFDVLDSFIYNGWIFLLLQSFLMK